MQTTQRTTGLLRRDAFARIAFWQYMAFLFLLSFVWVLEILDIPHRAFGAEATAFNLHRVCLVSAAVIGAAVIAIGCTYEQQRAMLRNLLRGCLYCHRVKTADGKWEHVDEYFMKHYPISLERNACPGCEKMLSDVNGKSAGPGGESAARAPAAEVS